ncbi:hypothetical protein Tco_1538352 [Tanacetum coccineum]
MNSLLLNALRMGWCLNLNNCRLSGQPYYVALTEFAGLDAGRALDLSLRETSGVDCGANWNVLGYYATQDRPPPLFSVGLILNGLTKDFVGFARERISKVIIFQVPTITISLLLRSAPAKDEAGHRVDKTPYELWYGKVPILVLTLRSMGLWRPL